MHALRKLLRWVEQHILLTVFAGVIALIVFGLLGVWTKELAVGAVGVILFSSTQLFAIMAAVGAQSRGAVFSGWKRFAAEHRLSDVGRPSMIMGMRHETSFGGAIGGRRFHLDYAYFSGTRSFDRTVVRIALLEQLPFELRRDREATSTGVQIGDAAFDRTFSTTEEGSDSENLSLLSVRTRRALLELRRIGDVALLSTEAGSEVEIAAEVPIGASALDDIVEAVRTIEEVTRTQRELPLPARLLSMALRDPEQNVRARARRLLAEQFPDSEEARLADESDVAELPSGHLAVAERASGGEVSDVVEEGSLAEVEEEG